MKKFLNIFLISLFLILSATAYAKINGDTKEDLIQVDKEFSNFSINNGIGEAFIKYSDNDVILMRDKQFPIKGRNALREYYSKIENGNVKLEWTPVKAEISESGELGYTFGNWVFTSTDEKGKESKTYGNYVSIWKKQSDGSWRFVLDGGNTTPSPNKEN